MLRWVLIFWLFSLLHSTSMHSGADRRAGREIICQFSIFITALFCLAAHLFDLLILSCKAGPSPKLQDENQILQRSQDQHGVPCIFSW